MLASIDRRELAAESVAVFEALLRTGEDWTVKIGLQNLYIFYFQAAVWGWFTPDPSKLQGRNGGLTSGGGTARWANSPVSRPMGKSERLRDNLLAAAKQGRHPGNLPLGYSYPDEYGGIPSPDPETAPLIREAFRRYDQGESLGRIAAYLNAAGLRSRRGRPVSRQMLHGMIRNPFYVGKVRLNLNEHPGLHQPLVEKELFDVVSAALKYKGKQRL